MEPATAVCTAVAALALGGWLIGRVSALVLALPGRLRIPIPNRVLATVTLAVFGFTATPRAPAAADPVPPLVRLADQSGDTTTEPVGPAHQPGSSHVVTPGDSLWRIAAAILAQRAGGVPGNGDIAGFWPRIYEANREVIGDDPNLILPGQHLTIP